MPESSYKTNVRESQRHIPLFLLLFACREVSADNGTSLERGGEISTIVVAATRLEVSANSIPASISVVSGEEVQNARQQMGLDEALASVPGLKMSLAYTWSQFEFDTFIDDNGIDFSGNTIPGKPKFYAHADISYRHEPGPERNVYGGLSIRYRYPE